MYMRTVPAALVVVWLAWTMLMFAATSSSEITRGTTIDLDLNVSPKKDAQARYSEAIEKLRVQLKGQLVRFGIPVLREPATKPEYVYVRLIAPLGRYVDRKTVVLAIRKSDVYVVGYSYTNDNQLRARFFKDIASKEYATIFPGAQNRGDENMGYVGSYRELQARAGVGTEQDDRRNVQLGMAALGGLIDDISKTPQSDFPRNEARLLLIAIQMVCEAVRFKYIQNQVRDNIPRDFSPDFKVISLENNWGAISKAIASVQYVTQKFKNNLILQNADGGPWIVTNAEDIRKDMGLLNYVPPSELPKWLMMQELDHSVPAVSAQ